MTSVLKPILNSFSFNNERTLLGNFWFYMRRL